MFFGWLRRRQRRAILAQPFPRKWWDILERDVRLYRQLTPDEQARLRDDLRIFSAEKHWEGCGGQEIDDRVKILVGANACLLLLGLDPREHNYFPGLRTILVYPQVYLDPQAEEGFDGVHHVTWREGEAWYRGPVVLSWHDVLADSRRDDGHNLVLHEFAHQLDMQDDVLDGTPPLPTRQAYEDWRRVMTAEFARLAEASAEGRATLLDEYGATDEAEFFAVATECFFERGRAMRQHHPDLYALLKGFYRQDTESRS